MQKEAVVLKNSQWMSNRKLTVLFPSFDDERSFVLFIPNSSDWLLEKCNDCMCVDGYRY